MERKKRERLGESEKASAWKLFSDLKPSVQVLLSDEITSYVNTKQDGTVPRQISPHFSEILGRIVSQSFAVVAPGSVDAGVRSKRFQRVAGFGALATIGAILPRDQGDVR